MCFNHYCMVRFRISIGMIFTGLFKNCQDRVCLLITYALTSISPMHLTQIDRISGITPGEFREKYFLPQKPVIISNLSRGWQAHTKWSFDYIKSIVGGIKVGVYNNIRAGLKCL